MKASIKRIEATLHDLGSKDTTHTETSEATKRPLSFRISVGAKETAQTQTEQTEQTPDLEINNKDNNPSEQNLFPHHDSVQTFSAEEGIGKTPSLPKFKNPTFSSHRHAPNPALAMNILQEIQEHVAGWQQELKIILQQIQDIYLEGPIINGWLESSPQEAEPKGTAALRHAEVEQLMNYVEEICANDGKATPQNQRTGYNLCGLDNSGKVWSRPCPTDQLASVSVAIARYQKLRQLLGRKQYLETRLSNLAQALVVLHSNIQQT